MALDRTADLARYQQALERWLPRVKLRPASKLLDAFDGVATWKSSGAAVRYLVEEKRQLRTQDATVVADLLRRRRDALPPEYAGDRLLLLAPHVRPQQAAIFERHEIDYLDLAGNAHLRAPGVFVHVEGRQPEKEAARGPGRPQKGWIKTVMAMLVRPELVNAPYRTLASQADVAFGTVVGSMNDLTLRGLVIHQKGGRRLTDPQALLALWVQAYIEALRPKLAERRLQVKVENKADLWTRLRVVVGERGHAWALTGADAAERESHFFRTEETEIYAPIKVFDDRDVQKALVAQPAARGGNLLVIEPPGPLSLPAPRAVRGALESPGASGRTDDVLPVAPVLLAYAELRYRGTEQALEAAELLLPKVMGDAGR